MAHRDIASTAEPWFLLPLSFMRKISVGSAVYGHRQAVNAFCRLEQDTGQQFMDSLVREFALEIYTQYARSEETFFVDKTPRYYFCLDELVRIFPDAKFIILLRNPLSIFSSAVKAFRKERLRRLDQLDSDFLIGPKNIATFAIEFSEIVHIVSYEELINDAEGVTKSICDYLEIPYESKLVDKSFSIGLKGHGDKLGARQFQSVMDTSNAWKETMNTRARKWRLKRMLKKFPDEYLAVSGFKKENLEAELNALHCKRFGVTDWFYLAEESIFRFLKKIKKWMHA